jgi:hypothetical protein
VGLLGTRHVILRRNVVTGNRPAGRTLLAGGVILSSATALGGADPTGNVVRHNRVRGNAPGNVAYDGSGQKNRLTANDSRARAPARVRDSLHVAPGVWAFPSPGGRGRHELRGFEPWPASARSSSRARHVGAGVEPGIERVQPKVVPPKPVRTLRNLTRYRKSQIRDRQREMNRLHKVMQHTGIKLDCVATDMMGKSGRAMLDALVSGTTDAVVLADLARGQLRKKIPALREALEDWSSPASVDRGW